MPARPKYRGHGIRLPEWWLEAAVRVAAGKPLQQLAAELSKIAGHDWAHTTVGNFLKNKNATVEMADAFCVLFDGLPPVAFGPRSLEEATEMLVIQRRYDKQLGEDRLAKLKERLRESMKPHEPVGERRPPRGIVSDVRHKAS